MVDTSAMQEMEMVARSHHISLPHFYPLTGCARRGRGTGLLSSALFEDLHIFTGLFVILLPGCTDQLYLVL